MPSGPKPIVMLEPLDEKVKYVSSSAYNIDNST